MIEALKDFEDTNEDKVSLPITTGLVLDQSIIVL